MFVLVTRIGENLSGTIGYSADTLKEFCYKRSNWKENYCADAFVWPKYYPIF